MTGAVVSPENTASQYCALALMLPGGARYRLHCAIMTHMEKNSATTRRRDRSFLTFAKWALK